MGPSERLILALTQRYGFDAEVPFYGLDEWKRHAKSKAKQTPFRWDAGRADCHHAVEYQGEGAGHSWGRGMTRDASKLTEGQLAGWTIILCTARTVDDGSCLSYIERALHDRGLLGPEHTETDA